MWEIVQGLRLMLTPKEKIRLVGVVILLSGGALMEIAGLGLLLPLVAAFSKPELFEQNRALQLFRQLFAGLSNSSFLIVCCLLIVLLYVVKNVWIFFTMHIYTKFVYQRLSELACRLYSGFLGSRYQLFSDYGKVELNVHINKVDQIGFMVLLPFMVVTVDLLTIFFISLTLLVTIPKILLGCGVFFAIGTLLTYLPLKKVTLNTGNGISRLWSAINKLAFYSLDDIKTIKITGTEDYFSEKFRKLRCEKSRYDRFFFMLGQIPRLVLETLAVISAIAMLAVLLWTGMPVGTVILSFSLLIAAMSRLLPSFSRINYSLSTIRAGYPMFKDMLDLLRISREELGDTTAPLPFEKELKVEELSFAYPGSDKKVLSNVSFILKRNSSLAIVGTTGSGKSTLVDLLLGFHTPLAGKITVDGQDINQHLGAWRKLIGLVPQFIVLADTTIAANVAVGIEEEKIDRKRIQEVLKIAQLEEFVNSLPDGMETVIGDNGMRLSGGQRQRLGIARALYRDPEIIVFDEATSALDTETENALMDAVEKLHGSKTLIMVAHRLSTVEKCDQRIEIKAAEEDIQ